MPSEYELKKDICEIGRRIYLNGYVAANDGNITIRIGEDEVLTTPTGVSKGFMTPEMIIKVNLKGEKISGDLRPSSEIKMHLRVYHDRPDVRAVIHAHPPTATGFAVAGIPLHKYTLPEVIISLGEIPIAEYGTPSTEEIPEAIAKYLVNHDACLLANHGALTVGTDVYNAYFKMETLEHYAKISLVARQLGGERELGCEEISKLLEVRARLGVPGRHPGCQECGLCAVTPAQGTTPAPATSARPNGNPTEEDLAQVVAAVTRRVLAEINS